MSIHNSDNQRQLRPESFNALEGMLDYAIIEAAELRLPNLVFLLRLARLEMQEDVGGDQITYPTRQKPTLVVG